MKTLMDKEHARLIKKFHTLLSRYGIDNEVKELMLSSYGVSSSKDMNTYELLELCKKIDLEYNAASAEIDRLRKRLIAAIFSWRKAMGASATMEEVKAIACRAAEANCFNKISAEKLRSLYAAFTKKVKDLERVQELTDDYLKRLSNLN
jgi:hypothetical protein